MAGKKKQNHATQSFQQMVGKANQEALKPYIHEVSQHYAENLANQIAQKMFAHLDNMQTRITAMEKVLQSKFGLTSADLREVVMDVEDEATGFVRVSRAAQRGDYLRITMSTKTTAETEFKREARREISNLGENDEQGPETKALNDALVGMVAGEQKDLEVGGVTVRLVLDRVSEAKAVEGAANG